MKVIKTILAVLAIFLAITGIVLCAVGIYYSWSLNASVTDTGVAVLDGTERILVGADMGLNQVNNALVVARSAVNNIDGAVRATGERFSANDLAYEIVDRTVGDTLYPRIVEARETATAVAGSVVAFNTTLETANALPFVNIPTLTNQLETAAGILTGVRDTVDTVRTDLQNMRAEAVEMRVDTFTDRTGSMIAGLDSATSGLENAQTEINQTLTAARNFKARLPAIIDLVSIVLTLVLAWFIIAQLCLLVHSWRYLRQAN